MNKHKLLEDICEDAQRDPRFFEDLLEHCGMDQRNIMQMYMVYKFKWNWSMDEYHDLGWDGTLQRWVEEPYSMAAAYADLYDENASVLAMYRRLCKYDGMRQDKLKNDKEK